MPATKPTNTASLASDPAFVRGLPAGNVRDPAQPFAAEFVVVPNVPVMVEHRTVLRNGRLVEFGLSQLQAICDRCNRRIAETGDYAAVTVGHTTDPDSPSPVVPELIGFAGPFRLGTIGNEDAGAKRYAILADFRIFPRDFEKFRKHPRRSPEFLPEKDAAEIYLDPIACLGAQSPRLDMGLPDVAQAGGDGAATYLYSAMRDGRLVERYAAAAPAAGNVFLPCERYQDPTTAKPQEKSMLSPEELKQIVDAIEQLDWVQGVKELLAAKAGTTATDPPADDPPAADPPADDPPAADPPADVKVVDDPPADVKAAGDAGGKEQNVRPGQPLKYHQERLTAERYRREVADLRQQLDAERGHRIDAERYSILAERSRRFAMDLDAEVKRCRYGRMNDEQFAEHLELIEANYRPVAEDMFDVAFSDDTAAAASRGHRPGAAANRERYGRDLSDRARKICEEKAVRGEPVSYEETLEALRRQTAA